MRCIVVRCSFYFGKVVVVVACLAISMSTLGAGEQQAASPGKATTTNAVPAGLVGSWYAGRGHTNAPYNPTTGAWGRPSGKGLVYIFKKDGSYTKAFQSYESDGACITGFKSGRLSIEGNTLTTTPDKGRMVFEATCNPSLNSDKPLEDLNTEVFSWELKPNENDPSVTSLYLLRSDGAGSTFNPI